MTFVQCDTSPIVKSHPKKYGDKKTFKKYKFAYRRYKRTKDKETKKLNELIFFIRKNG